MKLKWWQTVLTLLQKEINAENVAELEAYINEIAGWVTKKQLRNQTSRLQYMNRRPLSA